MYQQSLHKGWTFQTSENNWVLAEVPGCVHADLRRHELIPDPFYGRNELDLQWIEERDWNYQLRFVPSPEALQQQFVELVCEGLDTVATVRLNGELLLQCENMFHRHRVSVKDKLHNGENLLEIRFGSAMEYIRTHRTEYTPPREFNDPVGNCVRIRKEQCQFGWDWGPRFVTAGIWRPVYLEGWSTNRIDSVYIEQKHSTDNVELAFTPQLAHTDANARFRASVSLNGKILSTTEGVASGLRSSIANPQLWWPAGQGEQPLYDVTVELVTGNKVLSSWSRRIGLRTIELDMSPDEFEVIGHEGQKLNRFGLRVNGRLIFAKGANWIPAHSFVANLSREDYKPLLQSALDANMNIIRLWGGGIYEHDAFYNLCDELGLLVWNDFMFACTLYPADDAFLESVHREVLDNVTRIRHHASLALWCGNNELTALNGDALRDNDTYRDEYIKLFLKTIPKALREVDPITPYIHSSPLIGISGVSDSYAPSHDAHDWNVWHSRAPVEYYETTQHRFNSEFGMQSYPSPHIASTFCPSEELNILSLTFETHQKNSGGNATIFHYVAQQFRFPKDYTAVSYLSQLNQAFCMKTAIEHFRRQQPQCLGAMYWQLNDCWPVASWSSVEFGGNWKALHYYARRFFAPALVSFKMHGEDKAGVGNYRVNTRGVVELWTSYDSSQSCKTELSWQLATLDGEVLSNGAESVALNYGQSVLQRTLDFTSELERVGKDNVYVLAKLIDNQTGEVLSRNVALFVAPRFLRLKKASIQVESKNGVDGEMQLTLSTPTFAYGVCIEVTDDVSTSDNFFDLCPGETRTLTVRTREGNIPHIFSLVDTY